MNLAAVRARHRAATEVGLKLKSKSLDPGDHNILFASCSDIPELLDYIEQLRAEIADEIVTFADRCLDQAEMVHDGMTTCANDHNLGVVQTYLQAANIARVGQDYRNPNCTKCRDTRGGPKDHKTEDCHWSFPEEFFEERDQCYGRDLVQVGWTNPNGVFFDMASDPQPRWRPLYVKRTW